MVTKFKFEGMRCSNHKMYDKIINYPFLSLVTINFFVEATAKKSLLIDGDSTKPRPFFF